MSTHMFLWRNKKNINILGLKKVPYQELSPQKNVAGSGKNQGPSD